LAGYALIVSLCAVWSYAIWKQSQASASINKDIAEWTAIGDWARSTTSADASFLVPTSDIRTNVANSVQTDAVYGIEIFEFISHRQVWVDFVRGAGVIWMPSYYRTWRERLSAVLELHSLEQKRRYAASVGVDYVIERCQEADSEMALFRREKLCVFDTNARGK
jgi:hypothetical protein